MTWFQFLIGILKTIDGAFTYSEVLVFQFLIGILKTCPKCLSTQLSAKFQFLIGILKTTDEQGYSPLQQGFNSS